MRPLSCLSVLSAVNLLWPNCWMDQDATWYRGRLGPGDIVLDGGPSSPRPQKGAQQPTTFRPMSIVAKLRPSQQLLSSCVLFASFQLFFEAAFERASQQ